MGHGETAIDVLGERHGGEHANRPGAEPGKGNDQVL